MWKALHGSRKPPRNFEAGFTELREHPRAAARGLRQTAHIGASGRVVEDLGTAVAAAPQLQAELRPRKAEVGFSSSSRH